MVGFQGSLHLVGEGDETVRGSVIVEGRELVMSAAGQAIGSWPLSELKVRQLTDGFHMKAEGEELIFCPDDETAFLLAVGLPPQPVLQEPKRSSRKQRQQAKAAPVETPKPAKVRPAKELKPAKAVETKERKTLFNLGRSKPVEDTYEDDDVPVPFREAQRLAHRKRQKQIIIGSVVAFLLMAIFLPTALALLLVGVGGVGILAAVAGMVEPLIAAKIPGRWQPPFLLIVSTLVLMIGVLVAAIAG